MINTGDIKWLAGFIEGEGSFLTGMRHKGKTETYSRIVIAQKQLWPLEKTLSIMGCGHISSYKGCSYHQINGIKAIEWMMTLYPLMSPKRQGQIKKVIESWKCLIGRGGRNRIKTHCPQGHEYNKENTYLHIDKNGHKRRMCKSCLKTVED